MQDRINQLQQNENELLGNLKTLKLNKQLSEIEAVELEKAKSELESLQKLILALYTEWHQERGEGEKKVLKTLGGLSENYSYEEMVRYIVDYGKKLSTNQKLNDYLFKVLRGIQKLRRTLYPEQCN
jgi:poly-D-alanine transfer protein DltD